jgi:zinc/manganese transport system ATP-binding protein
MSKVIVLDKLSLGYQTEHPLTQTMTLQIPSTSMVALVGANGSGKSTLLKTIMGLIKPLSGNVTLDLVRSCDIAYLPQQTRIERGFPVELKEFVSTGLWSQTGWWRSMHDYTNEVDDMIEKVGLQAHSTKLLSELSGGQLQRALFARTLIQPSKLLLLDEPFNGVDEASLSVLLGLLKECQLKGATIVAAIHDIALVKAHFETCLLFQTDGVILGNSRDLLVDNRLIDAQSETHFMTQILGSASADTRINSSELDSLDHA